MPFTSALGSSMVFEGTQLQVGNGASPQVFTTIANVDSLSLPVISRIVEVTNVGDHWARRRPTLNDMGKIAFGVFWIPTEPTFENAITATVRGMRYLLEQQILADFQIIYPDGLSSTDSFPAYVTSFAISSKTGDVWKAACELSNDGEPDLV